MKLENSFYRNNSFMTQFKKNDFFFAFMVDIPNIGEKKNNMSILCHDK
jgi:hypothetical protein